MKLICARCGKPLKHAAGIYAGRLYGAVCMKRMGILTIKTRASIPVKKRRSAKVDQLDLFKPEGAQPCL